MLSAALQKNVDKMKILMSQRTPKNQDVLDKEIIFLVWESYNQSKLEGIDPFTNQPLNDQTHNFFAVIPAPLRLRFHSSLNENKIIQFGISTGEYFVSTSMALSKIIGYDYSPTAISHITRKGMQGRLTDLNKMDDESKKLACQTLIETDLSGAAEILIIRTLECLTLQAADLLLDALINFTKPGTRLYIENWQGQNDPTSPIKTARNIPTGYVPSFFAARTDFEFQYNKVTQDEKADTRAPDDHTTVERLVVRKR
jgi:hypothetical protein